MIRLFQKYYIFRHVPPGVQLVVGLSILYWIYLGCTTQMVIVHDASGYESLGRMIHQQGWWSYLVGGVKREPVFPLTIGLSMTLAEIWNVAYPSVQIVCHIGCLLLSQGLLYRILRLLKIHIAIIVAVLAYFAVSPAIVNSAYSLWSEILTYPIVLGLILTHFHVLKSLTTGGRQRHVWSSGFGLLLFLATMLKGVFEVIAFQYCSLLVAAAAYFVWKKHRETARALAGVLVVIVVSYYLPLMGYKTANLVVNDSFAVTDRGAWNLYARTIQRTAPLDGQYFRSAMLAAPDLGLCRDVETCDYWSAQSADSIWTAKVAELDKQGLPPAAINRTMIKLAWQNLWQHPWQYFTFYAIGVVQMLLWEGNNIGFVIYPRGIEELYARLGFGHASSLIVDALTLAGVLFCCVYLWRHPKQRPAKKERYLLLVSTVGLILLFTLTHGFFIALKRYALPLAPAYLICVAFLLHAVVQRSRSG